MYQSYPRAHEPDDLDSSIENLVKDSIRIVRGLKLLKQALYDFRLLLLLLLLSRYKDRSLGVQLLLRRWTGSFGDKDCSLGVEGTGRCHVCV